MNIEDLFTGAGIVVDDHVNDGQEPEISKIVSYLEQEKHIPLIKYESIPDDGAITHFRNINFILLDWELLNIRDEEGNPIPLSSFQKDENQEGVISFIKNVLEEHFIPIFIFSNLSEEYIRTILQDKKILRGKKNPPIFIKTKNGLFKDNECSMFEEIAKWMNEIPSVYVLKEWTRSFSKSISSMFGEMTKSSFYWPKILWECFEEDGVNASEEIASVISQNILSRMQPVEFEKEQIIQDAFISNGDEISAMLRSQRFTENHYEGSTTGDFYLIDGRYYVNIRPSCDCVRRNGKMEVYLIEGRPITGSNEYSREYGNFLEKSNEAILGPLYKNRIYKFLFRNIIIKDYSDIENSKKGRILPPFITHITEKYGLYIQRQGLPRIPSMIIPDLREEDKIYTETEMKEAKDSYIKLQEKYQRLKSKKVESYCQFGNCKVTITPRIRKKRK